MSNLCKIYRIFIQYVWLQKPWSTLISAAQLLGAWEERHSLCPLLWLHCGFLGFPLLPDRPGRRKRDIQSQGCWTPAPQSRQPSAKGKHILASRSTSDFSLHSQGPSWELFFKWSLVWEIHKTTNHKEIKLDAEPSFSLLRKLVSLDWMSWDRCFPKSSMYVFSCSVCPALWDLMDCSPSGSSVHGILQVGCHALVRGSSRPRDWICGS